MALIRGASSLMASEYLTVDLLGGGASKGTLSVTMLDASAPLATCAKAVDVFREALASAKGEGGKVRVRVDVSRCGPLSAAVLSYLACQSLPIYSAVGSAVDSIRLLLASEEGARMARNFLTMWPYKYEVSVASPPEKKYTGEKKNNLEKP